ncbi:hypothetical protein ACQ4PT_064654 [Festuca glaucescens]
MELGCPSIKDESLFMCSELYIAAFKGRTQVVAGLLTGRNSSGTPAAARNGGPAKVAGHGGRCTAQEVTAERSTVFHIAAGQGHGDLVAKLCYSHSSLLSAVNRALDTPLHSVARAGHADAVEIIVRSARANVEEDVLRGILRGKNEAGDTALHVAARHGHLAAVEMLVKLALELVAETNGAGGPAASGWLGGGARATCSTHCLSGVQAQRGAGWFFTWIWRTARPAAEEPAPPWPAPLPRGAGRCAGRVRRALLQLRRAWACRRFVRG